MHFCFSLGRMSRSRVTPGEFGWMRPGTGMNSLRIVAVQVLAVGTDFELELERLFRVNVYSSRKLTKPLPRFALEKSCKHSHLFGIRDGPIKVRSMNLKKDRHGGPGR
jgi:hypothetical protein